MRHLIVLLFLVTVCNTSQAQWVVNGTNLPADSLYMAPSIQYSAFHNQFFVLSHPTNSTVTTHRMDTMHIQNSTWELMDTNIVQDKFLAAKNGELVFATVISGELELTGTDKNGSFLWTSATAGLNLQGSHLMNLYEGNNQDIYVQYSDFDTTLLYKFMNNSWTYISDAKGKLDFLTDGTPITLSFTDDLTSGMESRFYQLDSFDGTNWNLFDSTTVLGDHFWGGSRPDFSISKLDSIYIVDNMNDPNLMQSIIHYFLIDQGQPDIAFAYGIGFGQAFNMRIINDSLNDIHFFYHTCDLGWNAYYTRSYDAETRAYKSSQQLYFGHPIETPTAYDLAVDEFNCVQFSYSYHSDFFQNFGPDTVKMEVLELCSCEYIESRNTISAQGNVISSNITELATYQWLECENNLFTPIPGENNATFSASDNGSYALEVTINGCIDTTECQEISGIGIDEYSNHTEIDIFPNPTSNVVNIHFPAVTSFDILLTDTKGRIVTSQHSYSNQESIDLSHLHSGMYLLRIQSGQYVKGFRVLKD